MGSLSIGHWLIVLVIVALVFGTGKLKNFGKDLGTSIREFKNAVKDEDKKQLEAKDDVVDVTAKTKETTKA